MTFDSPAIVAVGVYDFPLVDKYNTICIRVPTDFFELLRRPTRLFRSFESHPVFSGVLSISDCLEEKDKRKKENFPFHQITLYKIIVFRQFVVSCLVKLFTNFDYLADILFISISLSEVSSVIVGPPPLSEYTAWISPPS